MRQRFFLDEGLEFFATLSEEANMISIFGFFRGVAKLAACFALLGASAGTAAVTFAFVSGDHADRAEMGTRLSLALYDLGLKSDRDLTDWIRTHKQAPQAEVMLDAIRERAKTDPVWSKAFAKHTEPDQKRKIASLSTENDKPD